MRGFTAIIPAVASVAVLWLGTAAAATSRPTDRPTVPVRRQTVRWAALAVRRQGISVPSLAAEGQRVSAPRLAVAADGVREPAPVKLAGSGTADIRSLPGPAVNPTVEDAGYMEMVLTLVDEARLREVLAEWGVPVREDPNTVGELPAFTVAVGCVTWSPMASRAEALAGFDAEVKMALFVGDDEASVAHVRRHRDQRFLVVIDARRLSAEALRAVAGENVVAVVVGHYQGADATVEGFGPAAERALAVRKLIRLVSDVPVLLAVSPINFTTYRGVARWPEAFGERLDAFDGWAIYNLHLFPAILEPGQANPRTRTLRRLGLSPGRQEKPCLLLDFMGTPAVRRVDPPSLAGYVAKVWRAKWPLLREALAEQGWRGVAIYSTTVADARMKAKAVAGGRP